MSFTDEESAHLRSQPVTRFATVGRDSSSPTIVRLASELRRARVLGTRGVGARALPTGLILDEVRRRADD